MKLAAANAIAGIISDAELHPEYIVPSVFDKRVAEAVAREVEAAAYATGVARRDRGTEVKVEPCALIFVLVIRSAPSQAQRPSTIQSTMREISTNLNVIRPTAVFKTSHYPSRQSRSVKLTETTVVEEALMS